MIRFTNLEVLLVVPLVLLAAWKYPDWGLRRPLRALILLLLLLAGLNPQISRQTHGLDLWVLFDKSASAQDLLAPRQEEIQTLLERGRGAHDRLFYVDYAEDTAPRQDKIGNLHPDRRNATRTASALHHVLSRADSARATKVLLVTDGYSTEPLDDVTVRLARERVPVSLRLLDAGRMEDYRVAGFVAPAAVQPGEPFQLAAHIAGHPDGVVPCVLLRDDMPVARGTAEIRRGRGVVRWRDVATKSGAVRYTVRIEPGRDAHSGNNKQETWVEIRGEPRVLLVSGWVDDPLGPLLQAQGFSVELVTDPAALHPGSLTGARAVLLNNVPAYKLPHAFIEALPFHVHEQGGGLLMIGGRHSFAPGGYFESALDPLLPVSMELKQDHRRLATAMAITLDRSGSMQASVQGAIGQTKMSLANAGVIRAIELLGDSDCVVVLAVDTRSHMIVPLTTLGDNRNEISRLVSRIQSSGGGIFVFTALLDAWEEIRHAPQGQRHIILFADASDAEEPGSYRELLQEITTEGGTVSVIAMGTETDSDAEFLQDVALRGNGRIMFNADATTLPALFAQETVALGRSAFIEETTPLEATPGWYELARGPLAWPDAVDAYNLCYTREGATASLLTGDEYNAPLLAHWSRGLGRVGAVTFPLAGPHAARILDWPDYAGFARTLTRWLMGEETPPGLAVRLSTEGEWARVELLYDDTRLDDFAVSPPSLVLQTAPGEPVTRAAWQRMEPGRFSARIHLPPGALLRGAAQVGNTALPFGPLTASAQPEWLFEPERRAELRTLVHASGGREQIDLSDIWDTPPRLVRRTLTHPLLVCSMLLFLLDALLTRLGGRRFLPVKSIKPAGPHIPRRPKPVHTAVLSPEQAEPGIPPDANQADSRRNLFREAKTGSRRS